MSEVIFCVDSDGCVMDTMTFKHERFFGPYAADVYEVEDRDVFLKNWNDINLYTRTRGVNRFVGLVMGLESVGYKGIDNLTKWVKETESLSNDALMAEIEKNGAEDLKKALDWSIRVNTSIANNEEDDEYFEGAKEGLEKLAADGKVYVVSSANREAVEDEWQRHGLLEYVDDLYCQDRGKKEDVIAGFIAEGVAPHQIMMIGDSPGDLEAAEHNGTWFYPIIVGHEKESWNQLHDVEADRFKEGKFTQVLQDEYNNKFWANLDK